MMRFADQLDEAAHAQEQQLQLALRTVSARTTEIALRTGHCLNCEASVPPTHVYCDADCRADHEHRVQRERMNKK